MKNLLKSIVFSLSTLVGLQLAEGQPVPIAHTRWTTNATPAASADGTGTAVAGAQNASAQNLGTSIGDGSTADLHGVSIGNAATGGSGTIAIGYGALAGFPGVTPDAANDISIGYLSFVNQSATKTNIVNFGTGIANTENTFNWLGLPLFNWGAGGAISLGTNVTTKAPTAAQIAAGGGVTNQQSGVSLQSFHNVHYEQPALTYTATNPFDAVGNVYYPQWNGHYGFNVLANYYTNSASTNYLFFYNASQGNWEFSTNYPDNSGTLAFIGSSTGQTPFPTNTAYTSNWYLNLVPGQPNMDPDSFNIGTTNGITLYETNISVIPNGAVTIAGATGISADNAAPYVIKFVDYGVTNGVPLTIAQIGDQITSDGYTPTFALNGGTSGAFATFATEINGNVRWKWRFHVDGDAGLIGGSPSINQQQEAHYGNTQIIYQWVNPYGHITFGSMIDGTTNNNTPAILGIKDGSTNGGTDHVYPPFMLQHTLAVGPSTLPTIMTNGAFSVDGNNVYVDQNGSRGALVVNTLVAKTPTAVTLTGSVFTFSNATPQILECYFSGGTAYAVSKNGAAIYGSLIGDGYMLLQPTNKVAITYTVAPTFFTNAL